MASSDTINAPSPEKSNVGPQTGIKEVVREWGESLGIALILALILRHFVFEPFKIPTKSMEPTLIGDQVSGDKILVSKFIYDFFPPKRGEVIVFKNPQNPEKNYIKRLIGLPNEEIRISRGDIYVNGEIWRKPRTVQRALWMPVSTEDLLWDEAADREIRRRYVQEGLHLAEPEQHLEEIEKWEIQNQAQRPALVDEQRLRAWQPAPPSAWTSGQGGLHVEPGASEAPAMATYYRPRTYDRVLTASGRITPLRDDGIEDMPSYAHDRRLNTVDDLRIRFRVRPERDGEIRVVLSDTLYRCTLFLSVGQQAKARIEMDSKTLKEPKEIEGPSYALSVGAVSKVSFANVDDTLIVDVNDRHLIEQPYTPARAKFGSADIQSEAAFGAVKTPATFSEIRLERDIYYLDKIYQATSDDGTWNLGPKEYFVLGDNSPNSRDSRLWETGPSVPEENLIGEAFMVFWPPKRLRIIR